MRPGVRDPVEVALVGEQRIDEGAVVGVARGDVLPGVGVGDPAVGDAAGAVRAGLVGGGVRAARADAVEGQVQPDPGLLLPGGHVRYVGRGHLHVRRGVRRVVGDPRRAGVVRRVGGRRGALERPAPLVVGDEHVVDVLAEVVAVEAEMGVLGHPVDQPRGQQQPLGLAGVVVEVERQFGHPGLRVAVRVLVHPGHDVTGGIGEERRVRRPGVDRRPVAVAAGGERDRAL